MTRGRRLLLSGLLLTFLVAWNPAPVGAAVAPIPASIAVRPNCGPAGVGPPPTTAPPPPRSLTAAPPTYTLEVVGRGLPPNQEADVIFNPGGSQQAFAGNIDANGAIDQVIQPVTVPAGVYTVEVQPFTFSGLATVPGTPVRTSFVVPCPPPPTSSPSPAPSPSGPPQRVLNPTLTLTPAVGPPGTIVTVRGVDFPAGLPVQLAWSQGIVSAPSTPLAADGSGGFTTTVLVFPHDQLGARVLTAVSVTPPNSSLIGFASAFFLVVPGEVQPNEFSSRR